MTKTGRSTAVDVLTDRAELAAIEQEWADLADGAAVGPFGLPSFALPWWDRFGSGRLLVVTARRDGALVGLLPVHERSYGVGPASGHVIRWLGHGLGVVGTVLLDPGLGAESGKVADSMWSALAEAASPRAALQLVEYHLGGPGLDALRLNADWDATIELGSMVPVIDLEGRTLDELLSGSAKRKFRWKLSAAERNLENAGIDWDIEFVDEPTRFEEVLAEIDAAFDAAESHDPKLHFLEGEHRGTTLETLRIALTRGRVVIALLRLDGRLAAFDVSVRVGDRLCGYIRRTDPTARPYSPGHLLLRAGVVDAIERGIGVFDLGLGLDAYKKHWATGTEDATLVTAGRSGHGTTARLAVGTLDAVFELRRRGADR